MYNKLFIVGCGRSGTTWALSIFREHPSVITIYTESKAYPWIMGPFIRLRFKSDKSWQWTLNRYDSTESRLSAWVNREKLCRFIKEAETKKELSNVEKAQFVIDQVFDNAFQDQGGNDNKLLVEKTPTHIFYADKILKRYPEAKIIELVRDGRDVCVSLEILGRHWTPKKRKDQIKMWREFIEAGMKLHSNKSFTGRILRVRYEKMKENPVGEISRMFEFAGIDNSLELVCKIAKLTDFNNYKDVGAGKDMRKGVVGDWKNHFSSNDVKLWKTIGNDLLVKLGYNW